MQFKVLIWGWFGEIRYKGRFLAQLGKSEYWILEEKHLLMWKSRNVLTEKNKFQDNVPKQYEDIFYKQNTY